MFVIALANVQKKQQSHAEYSRNEWFKPIENPCRMIYPLSGLFAWGMFIPYVRLANFNGIHTMKHVITDNVTYMITFPTSIHGWGMWFTYIPWENLAASLFYFQCWWASVYVLDALDKHICDRLHCQTHVYPICMFIITL